MKSTVDLKSYFQRIGYVGAEATTLDVLQELHRRHTQAVAFENLNPFLGIPVKLDMESIEKKLVHDGRGGYCFEQNLLFKNILEQLGFSVKGLAARVLLNQPDDRITRRSHMLLLIAYEDKNLIADVGFGTMTLTGAIELKPNKVQKTPHEQCRLLKSNQGDYFLQIQMQEEWKTMYRFDLQRQFFPDYEMANWYVSTNPESHFVTDLIIARSGVGCRYTLHNNQFRVHYLTGKAERQVIGSSDELRGLLENEFQLNISNLSGLDLAFERRIKP